MPVSVPCPEHLVDQVGEATGDREEGRVSRGSRKRHSRLEEVARAVELVAHLQVGPPPGRVDDLAPAVEIAVRLLRGGDELRRLAREALELGRRLAPELPGDRLEPLVDVGVAEDHAPPLARGRPAAIRRLSSVPARSSSSAPRRSVTSRFTRWRSASRPSRITTPRASIGRSRTRAEAVGATLVTMLARTRASRPCSSWDLPRRSSKRSQNATARYRRPGLVGRAVPSLGP